MLNTVQTKQLRLNGKNSMSEDLNSSPATITASRSYEQVSCLISELRQLCQVITSFLPVLCFMNTRSLSYMPVINLIQRAYILDGYA